MSEFSECKDFEPLMESYKKEQFKSGCGGNNGTLPIKKYLKIPKMKKLHKESMKLQGAEKVIKMVKEQGES